jgi:hypothetical protein
MAVNRITVNSSHTIHVDRPPEQVFDYTQDYATRADWDPAITHSELLSDAPRRVRATIKGVGSTLVEYKLFRRGERTSAAFTQMNSRIVTGGGGSWSYAAKDGGTDWTQSNTLELRSGLVGRLLRPFVRWSLARGTRASMATAKQIIESQARAS